MPEAIPHEDAGISAEAGLFEMIRQYLAIHVVAAQQYVEFEKQILETSSFHFIIRSQLMVLKPGACQLWVNWIQRGRLVQPHHVVPPGGGRYVPFVSQALLPLQTRHHLHFRVERARVTAGVGDDEDDGARVAVLPPQLGDLLRQPSRGGAQQYQQKSVVECE